MHFYIHIPFCESKCNYCAFTSLKKNDYEKAYFKALKEDIVYLPPPYPVYLFFLQIAFYSYNF